MKFIRSFILATVLIGLLGALPGGVVQAEDGPTYPAEEYVRTELLRDGSVDLTEFSPDNSDRIIRGSFLVELFKDPAFFSLPFISMRNTTISGDILANGLNIPFAVECWDCIFLGRIELSNVTIRSFRMYNSTVFGAVRLGRAVIKEDLALYDSIYQGPVILFGANVLGNFYAAGSSFNGIQPDKDTMYPFELWKTQVAQTTEFRNATIKGVAMFEEAKFGGNLVLNKAVFEKDVNFKDVYVGNFLEAQEVSFLGAVNFESGVIDRDVKFSKSVFHKPAKFDFFTSDRFTDFNEVTFQDAVSFRYAETGWPDFSKSTFYGAVDFTGLWVENNINFSQASYEFASQPFTINNAEVNGTAHFNEFRAPAGLNLSSNWFGNLEISGTETPFAVMDLSSAEVYKSLTISDVQVVDFNTVEFWAGSSTSFKQVNVSNSLDMGNAAVGFFSIEEFTWPHNPEDFNLRGMEYADIGLGEQELNESTWPILLTMLEDSAYSPQAYYTLSQFLLDKGHPEWAAKIEISRKVRERDKIFAPRSGEWVWSWFMYLFSGYGQMPFLAFVWSALVVIAGAVVFRKEEGMEVVDDEVVVPIYNSILYSFDLFLPYVELGIADKWDPKPERTGAWLYKQVHQLLGWILMPIALLTFGGVIG